MRFANDLEDCLFGIIQAKNSVAAEQVHYTRCAAPNLARFLSNVPSGKWPVLRAISSTRQSEKPRVGRARKCSNANATTSASCSVNVS